ncbi:hypothetical protein GW17_00061197 [Ensete ventricosum]|nr:hypothetical protein GW17_00061197 [Ensete ventricosum]
MSKGLASKFSFSSFSLLPVYRNSHSKFRGEMMASDNPDEEAGDPDSTAEREPRRRSMVEATPSETELEDFFAAAEIDLRRRFTQK